MTKPILKGLTLVLLFIKTAFTQDIAVTTSVLSSVARELAEKNLNIVTLIPPGSCPGHSDLKISDLKTIEKSGILLAQGFEEYLESITSAVKIKGFKPIIIETKNNWFILANQKRIYLQISSILAEKFPQHSKLFNTRRERIEREIEKVDTAVKKRIREAGLIGTPIICNSHISEILDDIGFNIIATYGRKEELTPLEIKDLITLSRKREIVMVIDNIQAGSDTGKIIALELNIPHAAISNFPNVFPDTPTLRETLFENCKRIISVYETAKNTTR